ncbi:MAG: hypothetical protein M1399_09520 [Actinobacteria bacterium]|nr:hypothetical protein [Actinomycetota bacterium]MCL5447356.1 hypothetical protein [Actinomycetota bacterium]
MENSIQRNDSVGATPLVEWGQPVPTFKKGRICRQDGCRTRLSIYNPGEFCYRHEARVAPRARVRKTA